MRRTEHVDCERTANRRDSSFEWNGVPKPVRCFCV